MGPATSNMMPRGPKSRKSTPAKVMMTPQTARVGHINWNLMVNNIGFIEKVGGPMRARYFTARSALP